MSSSNSANFGIMVEPLSMCGMSVEQYLQNLKMQFTYSTGGTYFFNNTINEIHLAGNTYKVLSLALQYPSGMGIYQSYCVRIKEDRLIILVLSWAPGYEADLQQLLEGLSKYTSD